jgi:hypothetical protein
MATGSPPETGYQGVDRHCRKIADSMDAHCREGGLGFGADAWQFARR